MISPERIVRDDLVDQPIHISEVMRDAVRALVERQPDADRLKAMLGLA